MPEPKSASPKTRWRRPDAPVTGIGGTRTTTGQAIALLGPGIGWAVSALEAISNSNVTAGSLFRYNDGQCTFNLKRRS